MVEKVHLLGSALTHLTNVLEVTVNTSTDPVYRQIGIEHLMLARAYQNQILRMARPLAIERAQSIANEILHYSQQVENYAGQNDWRRALEQSHYALSALPGEPGSDPVQVPPLPWDKAK